MSVLGDFANGFEGKAIATGFATLDSVQSLASPLMSITLNSEQETIIANLIATGSFQTTDEVLQVAFKLLEQERLSYDAWLTETREKVQEGIESLDRGEGVDGETVVNDLLAKLRQAKEGSV